MLVRSVVTTKPTPPARSACSAAISVEAAPVAHACESIGPDSVGAPRRAATVGAP